MVEPSIEEARDAFAARRAVEGGMLRQTEGRPLQSVIRMLRLHIDDERASYADHARIVGLLEAGDIAGAERLMLEHIGNGESALGQSLATPADAGERLRAMLAPVLRPKPKLARA